MARTLCNGFLGGKYTVEVNITKLLLVLLVVAYLCSALTCGDRTLPSIIMMVSQDRLRRISEGLKWRPHWQASMVSKSPECGTHGAQLLVLLLVVPVLPVLLESSSLLSASRRAQHQWPAVLYASLLGQSRRTWSEGLVLNAHVPQCRKLSKLEVSQFEISAARYC